MATDCPLANQQESILRRWEKLSRLTFEAASDQERILLRDHLPNLLNSLCRSLCGHREDDTTSISKIHGRQRFTVGKYSLEEVLGEYSILKNVVFETITAADRADLPRDFMRIGNFFDEAASTAAAEFSKLREAELQSAALRQRELNSELERFSAIAAHDLRSPIGSMIGFLEVIAEDAALGDPARTAVARGEAAGRRCLSLIDKLLAYASVGKTEVAKEPVLLTKITDDAIENLRGTLDDARVRIEADAPGTVCGDADLLTQVMQNLLGNSLKYRRTDRPCEIDVRTAALTDGWCEVSVADNGVGFEPKLAEEIFQPFTRGHSSEQSAGNGLGLATCQKIVEAHGGRIRATSQPNVGTTVTFSVPVAPPT